jgi:hypothetical protein
VDRDGKKDGDGDGEDGGTYQRKESYNLPTYIESCFFVLNTRYKAGKGTYRLYPSTARERNIPVYNLRTRLLSYTNYPLQLLPYIPVRTSTACKRPKRHGESPTREWKSGIL